MYNAEDDMELDRLSKEAADKYEAPGNADWSKMLVELDKVLPIEKKRKKYFLFWWLLPMVIISSVGIFLLQNNHGDMVVTKTRTNSNSTPIPEPEVKEKLENNVVTAIAPKIPINETEEPNKLSSSNKENLVQTINKPVKQIFTKDKTVTNEVKVENTLPSTILSIEKENVKENVNTHKNQIPDAQVSNSENKIRPESKKETIIEIIDSATKSSETDTPYSKRNNSIPLKPQGKSVSFALLAGVDKSTVKFSYGNEAGYNLGISLGYHFNQQWSLHSGAIYTQKNYKLAGEDFSPPKGSWIANYKLETVEGYCRMWEVPIQFRYALQSNQNNHFFLSTGLSSYFMTKENYTYSYYWNGSLVNKSAAYESSDTHILSILHFSGGYEKRINNALSVLIEPYAKIPLQGVGLGNIQLSSFGINFSAQFRSQMKVKK